jgi:hypothetical protein
LHPNNADYQLIPVPFLEKEMVDLFAYRKQMLVEAKELHEKKKTSSKEPAFKVEQAHKVGALNTVAPKGALNTVVPSSVVPLTVAPKCASSVVPLTVTPKGASSVVPSKGQGLLLDLNNL